MLLPEWKKILILVVGLLEILIFSGTILGWASLKLMLKNEQIYGYKCSNTSNIVLSSTRSEQISQLTTPIPETLNSTRIEPFLVAALSSTTESPLTVNINGTNFDVTTKIIPTIHDETVEENDDDLEQEESQNSRSLKTPPLLSQVSLKLDLTVSGIGNGTSNNQTVKSIVIPFESNQSLDSNLIYELVNSKAGVRLTTDSRSNRTSNNRRRFNNQTSAAQPSFLSEIRLFPRFIHPTDGRNLSTLEELLHIYLSENIVSNEVSMILKHCLTLINETLIYELNPARK